MLSHKLLTKCEYTENADLSLRRLVLRQFYFYSVKPNLFVDNPGRNIGKFLLSSLHLRKASYTVKNEKLGSM